MESIINATLVDRNSTVLVEKYTSGSALDSIREIKEASELAEVIHIVYKKRFSLRSIIDEMRIQYQEAREGSQELLGS